MLKLTFKNIELIGKICILTFTTFQYVNICRITIMIIIRIRRRRNENLFIKNGNLHVNSRIINILDFVSTEKLKRGI